MANIIFKLRKDTPAGEVGTALKEICGISALFNVKAVFPEDADRAQGRLYAADVKPDAEMSQVLAAVRKAPYVETAYEPPTRRAF